MVKPKHVGAVLLILECFNNSTFFNVVCVSWQIKVLNCIAKPVHIFDVVREFVVFVVLCAFMYLFIYFSNVSTLCISAQDKPL